MSREACLARWPEAEAMAYHPSCCRFPKSCSIDPPHDIIVEVYDGIALSMKCVPCRERIAIRPEAAAASMSELNRLADEHTGAKAVDAPTGPDAAACDGSMVHYFGPPEAPAASRFDENGHPPNCPANAWPKCPDCGSPDGWPHYLPCPRRAKAVNAAASEPATPVEDTPDPAPCTCDAKPGQGHQLRCAVWQP